MTREEVLASADENVAKLVRGLRDLGITAAFVRTLDEGQNDFRLICLQTLLVRPLLLQAASKLEAQEVGHKC